jgi:enoyl-CoA hydratase
MTESLIARQEGATRWLVLNRPRHRNALDPDLVGRLARGLADAVADPGTRAIVIAGEGPSFCAGADLKHLHALATAGADPQPFLGAISDCFTDIEQAAKPVIAVVHGHAVAGGLELALACDVVIAQTGALLGDGHVRHGLLPAAGSSLRLPRKVGEPLARWLMLTGELLPAEALVGSGFVHTVVEGGDLRACVDRVANRLGDVTAATLARAKALVNGRYDRDRDSALRHEMAAFVENWSTPQTRTALRQFGNPSHAQTTPA